MMSKFSEMVEHMRANPPTDTRASLAKAKRDLFFALCDDLDTIQDEERGEADRVSAGLRDEVETLIDAIVEYITKED